MRILADWESNEYLPKMHTCEGIGSFPELTFKEIPLEAKSLAVVVDDPDAPAGVWDHLVVANIPITAQSMTFGTVQFSDGVMGQNSRGELGRGAPCPPQGVHRYVFNVYAIKKMLPLSSGFSKEALLDSLSGEVVAEAQLIGLYQKGK